MTNGAKPRSDFTKPVLPACSFQSKLVFQVCYHKQCLCLCGIFPRRCTSNSNTRYKHIHCFKIDRVKTESCWQLFQNQNCHLFGDHLDLTTDRSGSNFHAVGHLLPRFEPSTIQSCSFEVNLKGASSSAPLEIN